MKNLWTVSDDGELILDFHSGQTRGWCSTKRFIAILAGKQSGKTSWGPWWLWREIQRTAVPGQLNDYLAVTANFDLFKLKMLPELRQTFEHTLGTARYWAGDRILELADPETGKFLAKKATDRMWGRIILRSAEAPAGLESATARAAWLDEAGHNSFTLETWEAIQGRVSLNVGRVLFTTTLYNLGWLKTQIYDPWRAGDPLIDVIQFDSTENPSFSAEEAARLERSMPLWKFNMQYRGRYERPAGLIYDSFNERFCKIPRFVIPDCWPRYLGLDFGGVNTAGVFYAAELAKKPNSDEYDTSKETGRLFLYRVYHAGGRTAKEHAKELLRGEPSTPFCVGGSPSEGQWRREFKMGGLPVHKPDISEVEIGIDRVWGAHNRNEILVFDDLQPYFDEKLSYSRKVDEAGEPTIEIENKSKFHVMDAERYIIGRIKRGA